MAPWYFRSPYALKNSSITLSFELLTIYYDSLICSLDPRIDHLNALVVFGIFKYKLSYRVNNQTCYF